MCTLSGLTVAILPPEEIAIAWSRNGRDDDRGSQELGMEWFHFPGLRIAPGGRQPESLIAEATTLIKRTLA